MPRDRLDKTLADYVVIAISPALIMTLVGSLVYFLLAVSYRGAFDSRMHWILFWFVFGIVLVERIAIEEGRERGLQYGVVLSAVVGFAVMHFVDAHVVAWILMAIVWWCSAKLVWDCTLIDDSEDASGAGLLQTAGFNTSEAANRSNRQSGNAAGKDGSSRQTPDGGDPTLDSISEESNNGKPRPHAPGLWVMYFSLAALPLFGVGQLFIPFEEVGRRSYAFQLLAVYVASAIALLLTTSFLGLRRYLRQRMLAMPESMTGRWLGVGTGLMVVILLLALLIPRPQAEYSLTALIDKIDSKLRQASKFAVLKNDKAEGDGRRIGNQDPNARRPGDKQPMGAGQPGGQEKGNARQGEPGDDQAAKQNSNGSGQQSRTGGNQTRDPNNPQGAKRDEREGPAGQQRPADRPMGNQPTPAPRTNLLEWLASLVKWILYGLLVVIGVYFLRRYWPEIANFLARLWAEILSLFGRRPTPTPGTAQINEASPRMIRPFASYANPFTNGAADRMSPAQLVSYTFEALEAWSRERAVERTPEQTPLEFAGELGRRVPTIANEVAQTTQLYMHIAYSPRTPSRDRLEILERMWRRFDV